MDMNVGAATGGVIGLLPVAPRGATVMAANRRAIACALACMLVCMLGCSRNTPPAAAPTPTPSAALPAPPVEGTPAEPAAPAAVGGGLAGTSWRLVQIMSMDDTIYRPDDRSLYTLAFGGDGSVRVTADCNAGTGSWSSESASQLQFGTLAATQAECGPTSLHDRYMSQFQWVRSYVLKDGHLFLATMADGAIIEFEPAPAGP
jgi:heat shock protein HslJ